MSPHAPFALDRRTLLAGAAAAATTTAFSAGPAAALVGRTTSASATDWAALDRRIRGDVLTPGESGYATAKQLFNPRYDRISPAAVVRVRSTADVAEAVTFAERHGVPTVVRSGGHSYTGASVRGGAMVIDLRGLHGVTLDGTTALVGGGALLYPVKAALAAKGRSIPTGSCPTVGAGGLTLGGGVGVDSRRYGLTSDTVVGATVVTKGGVVRRVSASSGSNLFWALQGGGTGLGVVTAWRYRTHVARSRGLFFLTFPSSAAARVLTGWARWSAGASRTAWASVHVEARGSRGIGVRVVGVCDSGDEGACASALARTIGVSPTSRSLKRMGHLEATRYLGGGTTSAREAFSAGSDVVRVMTTGTAEAIVGIMARRARAGGTGAAIVDPLDGRVSDYDTDHSAFPWRNHTATIQWYVGGSSWSAAAAFVQGAHTSMGSRSSGGYLNYVEAGRPLSEYLTTAHARRVVYLRGRYGVG